MKTNFFSRSLFLAGAVAIALGFSSCKKDDELVVKPTIDAPDSYNFQNVDNSGQVVRLLLLKDLEAAMERATTEPVTAAGLKAIFENTENRYSNIGTGKRLSDKMSDPATRQQVEAWFDMIETQSSTPERGYIVDNIDLKQMVAKTIMGSVFYYRAMTDYINTAKLNTADNNTVNPGSGTVMEHYFDEGFGYFGAARNYNQYSDSEVVNPGRKDSNGDGSFDPLSEVNYFYAQTAAKRDLDPSKFTTGTTDFTRDLFRAFVEGRFAISQKSTTRRDEAVVKVRESWDRLIAATVIHYGKEVLADKAISNPTPAQQANLAKHWSEMLGYFNMIKYNSDKKLSDSQIATISALLGTNSATVSVTDLESAISSLKTAYSF